MLTSACTKFIGAVHRAQFLEIHARPGPFGQHQESRPLEGPTPEVRDSKTFRHSAHAQSKV